VDVEFTARMEDSLDDIASGEVDPVAFLSSFYRGDEEGEKGLLNEIEEEMPRIGIPEIPLGDDPETGRPITVRIGRDFVFVQRGEGGEGGRATLPVNLLIDELTPDQAAELIEARSRSGEPLGVDKETGLNIYGKVGPYGPYIQLGDVRDGMKPKRVSLPKGRSIEDVDLPYARRLLSLPRRIGEDPDSGEDITAGLGRYGPYVARARTFRKLPDEDRIFDITLDEALQLLSSRRTRAVLAELGPHPETGQALRILEGRYGPYVTDGSVNASLPKGREPESVSVDEAVELLVKAATRGKGRKRRARKRG
jgi:DNA topoisomerase-1